LDVEKVLEPMRPPLILLTSLDELSGIPPVANAKELPHQRRERYLRLAMKARERAEYCADSRLRERFLSISKVWEGLANFIDRSKSH
jgi:hypothetical protein